MQRQILRIATRKSPLALWQANFVGELIKKNWPALSIELVPMLTSGDRFNKDKLQALGGKGLFVKELEEALSEHRADLAVHSMKDVPASLPDGLQIVVICKRDNPFDVLISHNHVRLDMLPKGSIIGTTSLRRQAQLLAYRSDFVIKPLRGNINTRLNKLKAGEYDAIILAAAGLSRLNLNDNISEVLDEELMLPACAQGALGIECRSNDDELHKVLAPLNDILSATCVEAERHVNKLLGGNCHVPLAVYCQPENDNQVLLRARVMSSDGKTVLYDQQSGSHQQALFLANQCANNLLKKGAQQLLEAEF